MILATVCPHCQKQFTPCGWSRHDGRCAVRPEATSLAIEAMIAICPDGSLPSMDVYGAYRKAHLETDYPDQNHLVRHYGNWAAVGKAFGLTYAGPVKAMPGNDVIWAELRKWFNATEPPYFATAWDAYARENHLPVIERISRKTGRNWLSIVNELEPIEIAPVRSYVDEKTSYRPLVRATAADKDRAERLCAGIADELERAKVFWSALGFPAQVVAMWT